VGGQTSIAAKKRQRACLGATRIANYRVLSRSPAGISVERAVSDDRAIAKPANGAWVLRLPERRFIAYATEVKGMLFVTSRQQLRAAGVFARYEEQLAPRVREELVEITSSAWVPIEKAHAHFAAVDAIALSDADVLKMNDSLAKKIHGVFLSAVAKTIRSSGISPWSVVPIAARIWPKFFRGGAIAVRQEGPKDARVVVSGNPLVKYRYHRVGWGAHLATVVRMVVAKPVYTRVMHLDEKEGRLDYLLQWV
jgi:hypothetical protein